MADRFVLSIDLEAELQKIAQRQHLNNVHYLVQLTRHALRHDPGVIHIESTRRHLTITQDGTPFYDSELALLHVITGGDDFLRRQEALGILEQEHGIAILSAILSFPKVVVASGGWIMVASGGRFRVEATSNKAPGYRIVIHRCAPRRRVERKELDFFCAGCAVPIHYNGGQINRPMALRGQVLAAALCREDGNGELGIPFKAELSAMSYFKRGVRFGFRRFLDPHGITLEGYWDSSHRAFEPRYEQSIGAGEEFLHEAKEGLCREAASQFAALDVKAKERVRRAGLRLLSHRPEWRDAPLFDSVWRAFSFSMAHLENLERQFGVIPCSLRSSRRLPSWVPRLSSEQIHVLRDMGHPVALLSVTPPRLRWRGLAARLRRLVTATDERS
ncbi:hypothetical protein JXA88_10725 [Candidatus Fermentibacteria bacterium]|nr:hypothetical protein [Candidatus Fermentibacteria bacterium]